MRQETIEGILDIKRDCPNCNVVITAGTEGGHSSGQTSHANGYKADLRTTSSLNRYLVGVEDTRRIGSLPNGQTSGKLTRIGTRGGNHGGPMFQDDKGNIYVLEDAGRANEHWDVCFQCQ